MSALRKRAWDKGDRVRITLLRVRAPDGQEVDVPIPPDTNALFLSFESAKELLSPYYAANQGLGATAILFAQVERRWRGRGRRPGPIVHTDWCELDLAR